MQFLFAGNVLTPIVFGLFSGGVPTWTDKEVLGAVGSVVATMLGVGVPIVLYLLRRADDKCKLKSRLGESESLKRQQNFLDLQRAKEALDKEAEKRKRRIVTLESFAKTAIRKNRALLDIKKRLEGLIAQHQRRHDLKEKELSASRIQLSGVWDDLKALRRRTERALQKDGRTWSERVLANAPQFIPLEPGGRQTPVLAVLNLKGGVGKTTITANLGAALDGMGYRVLLVDLDLQGSLTNLFLTEDAQTELYRKNLLLGNFYSGFQDGSASNLLSFAQPILQKQRSCLVPTTDELTYAEMNLTMRWLLREEGFRDPRFMLRRELQRERLTRQFDIVLLDCPPFINISCVNALAACDYVVVPIMPSKPATDRVPILLERLKEFRENIQSGLNVLGIVANRTHKHGLTLDEQNRVSALKEQCKDFWGSDILPFETTIRQTVDLRNAEDNNRPLKRGDGMYSVFVQLAKEVQFRLPTYCKPAVSDPDQVLETRL
ncbi:MAG: ParA family protein [Gemmataceae bacterium]